MFATKTTNSTKLLAEQGKIYFEAVLSAYGKFEHKHKCKVRTVYDANKHYSLVLLDVHYMRVTVEYYGDLENRFRLEIHNVVNGTIHSIQGNNLNDLYYNMKADDYCRMILPLQ